MEARRRKSSLIGPVILISTGALFLLNNLGWLSWDVWPALSRLWPVLLIGIGLELLIGRRSLVGSLFIVVILLGVLVAAIRPFIGRSLAEQEATVEEVSQLLDGAQRADVEILVGVGDLNLSPLPVEEDDSMGRLIEGQVALSSQARLSQEAHMSGDALYYALRSEGIESWLPWRSGKSPWADLDWDLWLNREIPMKLKMNTGVGSAVIDLSRMNITSLRAAVGVGETTLTLPRQGSLDATIETGVGRVTLIVPQGMAARITVHRGLGDIDVKGDYVRQRDTYTSPGYAMAVNRVELDVRCGIGEVIIR